VDAGRDRVPYDVPLPGDTAPPTPTVDFMVANCPHTDVEKETCTGTAPFTVQFVPIASSGISTFRWQFSDNSTDTTPNPTHTFSAPGSYDVILYAAGPSNPVPPKQRRGFIIVEPSPAGAHCTLDQQCSSNTCLCSSTNPCGYGPVEGICSSFCQKTSCPDGQACVNLVTTSSSARAEPWQSQVCLPACEKDRDCSAGLRCRSLPGWPSTATKVKACFVDVPGEMGSACVDSFNRPRNDLCLSGLCADLGALGLCSRDCSNDTCPAGSECAVFSNGRSLCLLPCSPTFKCDSDPLLMCVAADPVQGDFWVPSNNNGGVYCAPKPCVANTICGASGICLQDSGVGHCVSRFR
jgi:hypothetical protein